MSKPTPRKKGITIQNRITPNNSIASGLFLSELNKIKMMSREEEQEVALEAFNGDKAARDKLINSNMRFVISVAKQYQGHDFPFDDLVAEGLTGLIMAADRFEPNKGVKFISYAVWWIRQAIDSYVKDNQPIPLPYNKSTQLNRIKKKIDSLQQLYQREPSLDEILKHIPEENIKLEDLKEILNHKGSSLTSLESPRGSSDDDDYNLLDVIPDNSILNPEQKIIREEKHLNLREIINKHLPDREAFLIIHSFGLEDGIPKTNKEISMLPGVDLTQERVRQLTDIALRKLRIRIRARKHLVS